MHYHNLKAGSALQNGSPFICRLTPFVGKNNPMMYPFVCLNRPFVRNSGLTLVELIIVLTIVGVLAAFAAPGMQRFVANNRLAAQINDLMADVNLARSEAIKRNTKTTATTTTSTGVCTTATGTSCTAGGNWANGWLVYYNDNGAVTVLKVHETLSGSNTLTATRTDVNTNATTSVDTVSYTNNGALSSMTYTYRFTVCDPNQKQTRMIDITVVGQTSISSGTC